MCNDAAAGDESFTVINMLRQPVTKPESTFFFPPPPSGSRVSARPFKVVIRHWTRDEHNRHTQDISSNTGEVLLPSTVRADDATSKMSHLSDRRAVAVIDAVL